MPGFSELTAIGWNGRLAAAAGAAVRAHPDAVPGRVTRVDRGFVGVLTASGQVLAETGADRLATGDWVLVDNVDASPVVAVALARYSAFVRGDPTDGTARRAQVVAANVDTVFVTQSFESGPNLRRLERELVLAFESGAEPVIVLTKADLVAEPVDLAPLERCAAGVRAIATSAVSGAGIAELRAYTGPGRTVALIGASGVGKSTLVNCLVGTEVRATGAVRASDRRGRHTTTVRELVQLPEGGVLVDSPGLRAMTLWVADDGFRRAFADIESLAAHCRFHDCAHDREPGCAVVAALERGDLERERVLHYRELGAELDEIARRERSREGRANRRGGRRG